MRLAVINREFCFFIQVWNLLGFSACQIMSSVKMNNFTISFPSQVIFMYYSCLIALASASNTGQNRNRKRSHHFLAHDHRKKLASFTVMRLAVGFSYMSFKLLSNILLSPISFSIFIMKGCGIVLNEFSLFMIIFSLSFYQLGLLYQLTSVC